MYLAPREPFHTWVESLHRVLAVELFQIGSSPVRLLFIIKTTVFLFILSKISRLARVALKRILQSDSRFDDHRIYVLSRLLTIGIFVLGCFLGIEIEHISLHTFVLVGGTLGVAIGLGIQRYVGNVVAGLSLLLEAPIRLGDFIQVGAHQGFVEHLGTSATRVRTPDNCTVVIPNAELFSKEILNYRGNHTVYRLVLPVSVSYGVDPELVRDEMIRIVSSHASVLSRPEPSAVLVELKPGTINYQVRVWTKTRPENFDSLTSELYFEMIRIFKTRGISLPRAHLDVRLEQTSASSENDASKSQGGLGFTQ